MHSTNHTIQLAAFRDGDWVAFDQVWARYRLQIRRHVRAYTKDYDDGEELLQRIRIALDTSRPRYVPTKSLEAWIFGVSRCCCLAWARTNTALQVRQHAFAQMVDPLVDLECDIEAIAIAHDNLCERVESPLNELTPRQRDIIKRRILDGQSVADVAAALGCAPGTVKATTHIGLRRLRERLRSAESSNDSNLERPSDCAP